MLSLQALALACFHTLFALETLLYNTTLSSLKGILSMFLYAFIETQVLSVKPFCYSIQSILSVGLRSWFEFSAVCFEVTLCLSGYMYLALTPFSMSN